MPRWHRDESIDEVTPRIAYGVRGHRVAPLCDMLVFRSLVLGLLGACAILCAQAANRPVVVQAAAPQNRATIIDVAPGVTDVIPLLRLAPGEHVLSVGDRRVLTDLEAGAAIRETRQGPGHYVDLATTERRVLVLLH